MNVTDVTRANLGLCTRARHFGRSNVVELIGRPNLDVFQQDRLIPPRVNVHLKLILATNNFVIKSDSPQQDGAAQQNYKAVIQFASFIIYTKQHNIEAEYAHSELLKQKVMRMPYTRVQFKHLSIPQNQTSYNFDNVFTGSLSDLVVVGLLDDADFASGYQRNPFNFQNIGVNRLELRRNKTPVPRYNYTPNFANGQYIIDYTDRPIGQWLYNHWRSNWQWHWRSSIAVNYRYSSTWSWLFWAARREHQSDYSFSEPLRVRVWRV